MLMCFTTTKGLYKKYYGTKLPNGKHPFIAIYITIFTMCKKITIKFNY